MKKRLKKILNTPQAPKASELELHEREIFLKAYFSGEIEKAQASSEPEVPEDAREDLDKSTEDEERLLFLQAVNNIFVSVGYNAKPKVPAPKLMHRKRKYADAFIDLHGMNAEDAVRALLQFIKREKERGSKILLVVHGKGMGILRNAVWAVLETHPHVDDFEVAPARFGGHGALIIRINRKIRFS